MPNVIEALENILLDMNAEKVVFCDIQQSITGKNVYFKALEVVAFFLEEGLQSGDCVAVMLPNSMEFIFCYFACIFGGFTIIPINSGLSSQDIDYILTLTKPKLIIKNKEELGYCDPVPKEKLLFHDENLLGIFFTSGTTKKPKGVCHSVKNMLLNAKAFNDLVGLDINTIMLHVMPMGYMAGFLNTILSPILAGGSVVLAPQFNASNAINFWEIGQVKGINALWITPTMVSLLVRLNRDINTANWVAQNVQHVFVGTAPLPSVIKTAFEDLFKVRCLESYGMTEVMLVSSNTYTDVNRCTSVGKLLPGIEMKAVNLKEEALSPGEEGSLYIKTPFLLSGYFTTGKDATVLLSEDEWFATGDVGYLDEAQHLFITGRIKDLIIHGGINVSPRAVEEVLFQYTGVEDAVVIGKPHLFWGEEVIAFLVIKAGYICDELAIKAYCSSRLQPDAVPTEYRIVKALPRTSTGKVQNNKLKALL